MCKGCERKTKTPSDNENESGASGSEFGFVRYMLRINVRRVVLADLSGNGGTSTSKSRTTESMDRMDSSAKTSTECAIDEGIFEGSELTSGSNISSSEDPPLTASNWSK